MDAAGFAYPSTLRTPPRGAEPQRGPSEEPRNESTGPTRRAPSPSCCRDMSSARHTVPWRRRCARSVASRSAEFRQYGLRSPWGTRLAYPRRGEPKMPTPRAGFISGAVSVVLGVAACSSGSSGGSGSSVPAGACKTNGTATGSFAASCNQCGRAQCDVELSDKAGSGWAQQYFGGDGACAGFNDCLCACLASASADPLGCATTACIAKMDTSCQAAVQAAQTCLNNKCTKECK
jgi:hypothetical protein